jgi:hypothetical protein
MLLCSEARMSLKEQVLVAAERGLAAEFAGSTI